MSDLDDGIKTRIDPIRLFVWTGFALLVVLAWALIFRVAL